MVSGVLLCIAGAMAVCATIHQGIRGRQAAARQLFWEKYYGIDTRRP